MIYIDELDNLLEVVKDMSVATMGINAKNTNKGFHEGHDLCLSYLLNTDADLTMVQMSDASEDGIDYLDMEYMKDYLSNTGVDIFYYMSDWDYYDNWMPKVNMKLIKKYMKEFKIPKAYIDWLIGVYLSDQLYYRKYWIGSSKDRIRKPLGEFCKKYTRIQPIIVTRVKL